MSREILKNTHRKVCIGDLQHRVLLQDRGIGEPLFAETEFTESFDGDKEVWAKVRTVSGKTIFDGVNQVDVALTHEVTIRYDSTVSSETWIRLGDRRLDIIDAEDLDERNEWLLLRCTERGSKELGASEA